MLFYFTGTGNSLYAAQQISKKFGDRLISIHDAVKNSEFKYEAEGRIGFVYPVYYYGLPSTVCEFMNKLEINNADDKYIFSLVTCGCITGGTNDMFFDYAKKSGMKPSAFFALRMVDNYVSVLSLPSKDGINEVLEIADGDLNEIINKIESKECGDFDNYKGKFPSLRTKIFYPKYEKMRHTNKFRVLDSCVGCGVCAKNCNSEAIEIQNKHPVWVKDTCNLCLACLHRCPKNAIEIGKMTQNHGRFINPKADWKSVSKK